MLFRPLMEIYDLLDKPQASGGEMADLLKARGASEVGVRTLSGKNGSTDCIKILIRGRNGKSGKGAAPTLGIIGRLGGLGVRPQMAGFVSDGDGALAALTSALKLAEMNRNGDQLDGDVIIATHICPNAHMEPHEPIAFMGSPIDMETMNRMEVDPCMDAILSIDTTKGNRVANGNGFAISPTVKAGYILEVSGDLMDIMTRVTGKMPQVLPLAQQDVTPYGNGLHHLNSILQPSTATDAPVVGVAITTEQMVAGCATGATHGSDVEAAARFAVETAKLFSVKKCAFYNERQWEHLVSLYGRMEHFQTFGAPSNPVLAD